MAIISINKSKIYLNKSNFYINKVSEVSTTILTFTSIQNFQESPSGFWSTISISGGTFYGGISPYILPLNTDGFIQYDITDDGFSVNNFNIGLGFSIIDTSIPGDDYDYFIYVEGATGNYKTFDKTNGYVDSGIFALSGDIVKMKRIGSTVSVEYFRSGSWTSIITFPVTTSETFYIYGGGYDIGSHQYIVNPKGYNVINVNNLLYDITFPVTKNWSEVSSKTWGPTTFPFPSGASDGKSNEYIESGENGFVEFEINLTTPTTFVVLDLMTYNPTADNYYGNAEYNLFVGTSSHYFYSYIGASNGYTDSGIVAQTGDIVRLRRTTNTVYGEYFRNGIWNLIHQWSQTTTGRLWVVGSASNNGFLLNPKGYNLTNELSLVKYVAELGNFATINLSITGVTAGNLLVLTLSNTDDQSSGSVPTITTSLSLTLEANASGVSSGNARIYTATAPTGGTYNFTIGWSVNNVHAATVYEIFNPETSLGGNVSTSTGLTTVSHSITTTRENSIIIGVISDWNAIDGSTRTYTDNNSVETSYHYVSGWYTGYHYYRNGSSITTYNEGIASPTGQSAGSCLLEIRKRA